MGQLSRKIALTVVIALLVSVVAAGQNALYDWGGTTAAYIRHSTVFPGTAFVGQIFLYETTGGLYYASSQGTWQLLGTQYDINVTFNSTPGASEVGIRYVAPRAFNSPVHTNSTTSPAKALVAATAQKDFVWAKNGTPFCTMRFAGSATTSTYQSCSSTSFAVGDILTLTAPASPDATLANIGLTLPGILQ
jgi:hypothetical protein